MGAQRQEQGKGTMEVAFELILKLDFDILNGISMAQK